MWGDPSADPWAPSISSSTPSISPPYLQLQTLIWYSNGHLLPQISNSTKATKRKDAKHNNIKIKTHTSCAILKILISHLSHLLLSAHHKFIKTNTLHTIIFTIIKTSLKIHQLQTLQVNLIDCSQKKNIDLFNFLNRTTHTSGQLYFLQLITQFCTCTK